MKRANQFLNKLTRIYYRVSNPKLTKICIYSSLSIFILGLLIAVLIASIFGPQGYHIWYNYISDLGSIRYTPAPFILDLIVMSTSVLLLPMFIYFADILIRGSVDIILNSKNKILKRIYHGILIIIALIGLFWLIVGAVGLFGIGLFSEDRTTESGLHFFFSIVVFLGLALGAFFNGIVLLLKKTTFTIILGIYMILVPIPIGFLFLFPPYPYTEQFLEWMMFLTDLIWLIHISGFLLKDIKNKEFPSEK